ncbi:MAG: tyrosine-type recombinase/integrase [Candidatus Lokiarchaeota archaeon]|nr:tyrosine-type recombinase/integrase [Candidatus Lokiarchaeota archaeon]
MVETTIKNNNYEIESKNDWDGSIELINEFLDYKKKLGKSKSLIKNYRYDVLHFLKNTNVEDIKRTLIEDIEDYIAILRSNKCAGSTINRRICAIKSLIRFLRRKNHRLLRRAKRKKNADPNYLDNIRALIEEYDDILEIESVRSVKKEKLPFSMEELNQILIEIKKDENNRYSDIPVRNYLIIKLSAIGTGARNTAVRKLLIGDLPCGNCLKDCENCIPTIKLHRKGKKEFNKNKIRVRIKKSVCQELKNYIDNLEEKSPKKPVFASRNGSFLSIAQMNRILKKGMKLADIEKKGRTFHSLRHTFITEGIKNGTPWGHMMIQVDHKAKLGITGKYEHMQPEDLNIKFPSLPN